MPDCRYYEVCKLREAFPGPAGGFCILHYPAQDKSESAFDSAIKQQLAAGRSDFRYVHFTSGYTGLDGVHFPALADFRGAVSRVGLRLRGTRLPQGLKITGDAALEVHLQGAIVNGPVEIEIPVLNMYASPSEFHGDVSIAVNEAREIHLQNATLVKELALRARTVGRFHLDGATIQGILNLSQCRFTQDLTFTGTRFSSSSQLHLQGTHIPRDLIIIGRPDAPALICLNSSEIAGKTHIEAKLGTSLTRIVASERYPSFGGDIVFINVDLSECCLVGNPVTRIQQMELSNVQWRRHWRRSILYDEIAMRKQGAIRISNLKEVYQLLKEKYRLVGDHVTSGDFHYGEMQMRRKERGWLRFIHPEFLYWLLSGYGTGYIRAFFVLLLLTGASAGMYWWTNPCSFEGNFWKAFLFSVQVTSFQRPLPPRDFSLTGQWIQLMEGILGPLQIALFTLALRMRLKR